MPRVKGRPRLTVDDILCAHDELRREHPRGSPEHDEGLRRLDLLWLWHWQQKPPPRPSKRDADRVFRLLDMFALHRSEEGKALLARSRSTGNKGYRELAKVVLDKRKLLGDYEAEPASEGYAVKLAQEYGRLIKTKGWLPLTPRKPARKKLSKA